MDLDYAHHLLEETRQDYNLIAKNFARTRKELWPEIKFLFKNYLKEKDKVLDLGCGNGRWYQLIQKYNVDYVGVDSSEELIEIARESYPQVKFEIEEALYLPFSDNYFDKVYSVAVLHNVPSEELRLDFLEEAGRVLKPGGLLILTVWKINQLKQYLLLFKYTILRLIGKSKLDPGDVLRSWGKKGVEIYYHFFSKEELTALAKKAGFEVKDMGIVKNERGNRQNIYLVAQKTIGHKKLSRSREWYKYTKVSEED
jgi:ubiquinone/menaquinone biosynthesis C-methylase UbiE